ncbi:putative Ras GTPase-activating protein-binding protein [Helianthus annuus]|nr:putative Ras GTPase-activating protein-binding protein [Helianthus annuus]
MSGSDIHARDFVQPAAIAENGTMNNYGFQEQQLQAPVAKSILEYGYTVQTNGSVQNSVNALQNHMTPVEEVVEDPQKHTYASILQVAKGHLAPRHLESSRSRRVHPFQS